jgi:hypothetical protein
MLLAAWAFALVNNTPFALLHEAVHGVLSGNRRRNECLGTLCACAFPPSLSMQRIAHLGHHRRNRTDKELYDYYLPTQSKALRNFWLYAGNLFGLYWFCIPFGNLIYLCAPWVYTHAGSCMARDVILASKPAWKRSRSIQVAHLGGVPAGALLSGIDVVGTRAELARLARLPFAFALLVSCNTSIMHGVRAMSSMGPGISGYCRSRACFPQPPITWHIIAMLGCRGYTCRVSSILTSHNPVSGQSISAFGAEPDQRLP